MKLDCVLDSVNGTDCFSAACHTKFILLWAKLFCCWTLVRASHWRRRIMDTKVHRWLLQAPGLGVIPTGRCKETKNKDLFGIWIKGGIELMLQWTWYCLCTFFLYLCHICPTHAFEKNNNKKTTMSLQPFLLQTNLICWLPVVIDPVWKVGKIKD